MASVRCVKALYKIAQNADENDDIAARAAEQAEGTGVSPTVPARAAAAAPTATAKYPTKPNGGMLDQFAHSVVGWLAPENARNDWWDSYSKNKNAWKYATVGIGGAAIGGLLHQLSGAGNSNNNGGGGSSMLSWMLPLGLLAVGGKYMLDRFGGRISKAVSNAEGAIANVNKAAEQGAELGQHLNSVVAPIAYRVNPKPYLRQDEKAIVNSRAEQGPVKTGTVEGDAAEIRRRNKATNTYKNDAAAERKYDSYNDMHRAGYKANGVTSPGYWDSFKQMVGIR